MKLVYVVQNNDGIVMAVCLTKRAANKVAVSIGQNRWHEAWTVTPWQLDQIESSMLCGCESYQRMTRKMSEKEQAK